MLDFLDMGGYGVFIWPSYAITFITLIWLLMASRHRAETATRHLRDANSQNQKTALNQD